MENLHPLLLLASSVIIGILLEVFLIVRIRILLAKNNWLKGGKILKAFRGITFVSFLGLGVYLYVKNASMDTVRAEYFTKGLIVVLVVSICTLVSRIAVSYLTNDHDKREFQGTSIITNITRIAVYGIGLVIILQTMGISVTPILTAIGVGGLAVALALQDTLSNLFAGINIIASKKIFIGDFVRLQSGEEGFVEDISWRTITIIDTNETMIVIPNSQLSTAIFRNFNFPSKELILPVQLMVSYHNDLRKVEQIALEVAKKLIANTPNCVKEHTPLVRFHTFSEPGIMFHVTFRINETIDQGYVRNEYIKALMEAFNENGIEISDRNALRKSFNL